MRVLIVDDHALFRAGLVTLLNAQPDFVVVGEAGTMKEAIKKAHELAPELIIMDLGLPDGSGIEAMDRILTRNPQIKIVFLTIHESEEQAFTALRHGAKGYLVKNIPVAKLIASLRALERNELAVPRTTLSIFIEEILQWIKLGEVAPGNKERLTPREIQVLVQLSSGINNRTIAKRLAISENTVKVHVHHILEKLKLNSRREASEFAHRHGLGMPSADRSTQTAQKQRGQSRRD